MGRRLTRITACIVERLETLPGAPEKAQLCTLRLVTSLKRGKCPESNAPFKPLQISGLRWSLFCEERTQELGV